jgi:hypothetical protein
MPYPLPTIAVKHPDFPDQVMIINLTDFEADPTAFQLIEIEQQPQPKRRRANV